MKAEFKGIKIGNLVITTMKGLEEAKIYLSAEDVLGLKERLKAENLENHNDTVYLHPNQQGKEHKIGGK